MSFIDELFLADHSEINKVGVEFNLYWRMYFFGDEFGGYFLGNIWSWGREGRDELFLCHIGMFIPLIIPILNGWRDPFC
jgi:hypothetical protein